MINTNPVIMWNLIKVSSISIFEVVYFVIFKVYSRLPVTSKKSFGNSHLQIPPPQKTHALSANIIIVSVPYWLYLGVTWLIFAARGCHREFEGSLGLENVAYWIFRNWVFFSSLFFFFFYFYKSVFSLSLLLWFTRID